MESQLLQLLERARESIYSECQCLLDAAERAAMVPKAQRDAIDLLRGLNLPSLDHAVGALSVPWP